MNIPPRTMTAAKTNPQWQCDRHWGSSFFAQHVFFVFFLAFPKFMLKVTQVTLFAVSMFIGQVSFCTQLFKCWSCQWVCGCYFHWPPKLAEVLSWIGAQAKSTSDACAEVWAPPYFIHKNNMVAKAEPLYLCGVSDVGGERPPPPRMGVWGESLSIGTCVGWHWNTCARSGCWRCANNT